MIRSVGDLLRVGYPLGRSRLRCRTGMSSDTFPESGITVEWIAHPGWRSLNGHLSS